MSSSQPCSGVAILCLTAPPSPSHPHRDVGEGEDNPGPQGSVPLLRRAALCPGPAAILCLSVSTGPAYLLQRWWVKNLPGVVLTLYMTQADPRRVCLDPRPFRCVSEAYPNGTPTTLPPGYRVDLPPNHRFPMPKYRLARLEVQRRLKDSGLATFHTSPLATLEDLNTTHDRAYVDRFIKGHMTPVRWSPRERDTGVCGRG